MDAQKFSSFLQARRKELGLTQFQLAEKLHVTDKAVSRWERGVGLPDIHLLEPLAQALDLSLTELIRSEKIDTDILTKGTADAALAETLALAEKRRRKWQWRLSHVLVFCVACFLIGVINWFVDVPLIRMTSVFVILRCEYFVMQPIRKLLFPEDPLSQKDWKFYLEDLLLSIAVLLYIIIFLLQPYIGREACGDLALLLTALLGLWGLWKLWRHVRSMPDGTESPQQGG